MASAAAWLGGIGSGISAISNLGTLIYSIIEQSRETEAQHMARRQWERIRSPVGSVFRQMYFAPWMSGRVAPYPELTDIEVYRWAPAPAMREMYASYLGRTYGLPRSTARAMTAASVAPLRLGASARSAFLPKQFLGLSSLDPQQIAQSALSRHNPMALRQRDYLSNAARLAAFNLMRAQQLPYLIG